MSEYETFIEHLIYFGGNLGIRPKIEDYVDIEQFIVTASLFMEKETRVTQCFLNWLSKFAPYIRPSKIRRVLKSQNYSSKWMGVFVDILKEHPLNSQNWSLIDPFIDKKSKYRFKPNYEKYLKKIAYIIKNCIELSFRIEGQNQILADIKAYIEKCPNYRSLYQVAKATHNSRNRVNYEFNLLNYLAS